MSPNHDQPRRRAVRMFSLVAAASLLAAGCSLSSNENVEAGSLADKASLDGVDLTVGGKEFTEQLILCQMTIQALESAGATADDKCGLSGSDATRRALTSGEIDMYWEYTGTAWISYLQHTDPIPDATKQYQAVAKEDESKNSIVWLDPAPFNNTYAIAAKASKAKELGVSSLSDYAELAQRSPDDAAMCVNSEFAARNDGLPGLEKAYGFKLPSDSVSTIAEGTIYETVAKQDPCNFGDVATTDGRIANLDLTVLEDDKGFFPVYNPAPNVQQSVLKDNPDIAKVLNPIANALDDTTMRRLNGDVDIDGEDPADVAKGWLQDQGFIG